MKSAAKLLVMSLLACACALAQTSVPRVIATDLQSGPNTGGPNNKGTIVTLYGFGFGATQGASNISVGGISADNYLSWSNTKISFQIGTAAASGNVLVNTGAGVSNPKPFTVRVRQIIVCFAHRRGHQRGFIYRAMEDDHQSGGIQPGGRHHLLDEWSLANCPE